MGERRAFTWDETNRGKDEAMKTTLEWLEVVGDVTRFLWSGWCDAKRGRESSVKAYREGERRVVMTVAYWDGMGATGLCWLVCSVAEVVRSSLRWRRRVLGSRVAVGDGWCRVGAWVWFSW